MNCPKCGYGRAIFDVSRKQFRTKSGSSSHFKEHKATESRTDFNATCPKCGHKWNTKEDN